MNPAPHPDGPRWALRAAWLATAALVFWSFGYTVMRGSDLWWHLAGGRWMVEHGTVFVRDPFSFTATETWWLNDAWLSDVLLYLWSNAFGTPSLAYWKWLCIVSTWLVLMRHLERDGDRIVAFLAATFSLAIAAPFLDVRPQLFSFLGFAVLIDLTLGRGRPSNWLVLLFFVWANLHAGFLIGVIVLPLLLFPAWWNGAAGWRRLLALAGACWLVCLVNPNGIEAFSRPFRYAFDASSPFRQLGEWLPAFAPGGIRSPYYRDAIVFFAVSAALVGFDLVRRRAGAREGVALALALLTLFMSLRSRRFVPFFALAQALPLAYFGNRLFGRWLGHVPLSLATVGVALLGLVWIWPYPKTSLAFPHLTAAHEFPVETCRFIEVNELSGRVFNYYNWGGYLHLCTNGQMKVFIDGRSETVYADETFLRYLEVLQERGDWQEVVRNSGAEYVLWPLSQGSVVRSLIDSGEWLALSQDYTSVLLMRADAMPERPWRPTPESAHQQLAIAWAAMHAEKLDLAKMHYQRALELDETMLPACTNLAVTYALAGEPEQVSQTVDRCNAIFPIENSDDWRQRLLATARNRRLPET